MSTRSDSLRSAAAARAVTGAVMISLVAVALVACLDGRIGPPRGAPPEADVDAAGPATDASGPAVDAASPDAAPDAAPLRTCEEIYGAASQYSLCDEQPTTCEFNVETNGGSCGLLCGNYGGTCLEAYDNDTDPTMPGIECIRKPGDDNCDSERNTEICVCTRIP